MDVIRLLAMARKEWIQLKRDPRSMALAFLVPLFMLLFFGYAITWDVNDIPLALVDRDRTAGSRELVEAGRSRACPGEGGAVHSPRIRQRSALPTAADGAATPRWQ
ncbi:MAG: hypothetical protein P8170_14140 [Gemmatimonadota bacterium]